MYLSDFVFFDSTSTETVSNECSVNPNAGGVTIQVTGETIPELTVEGVVDTQGGEFSPVAVLAQSDYTLMGSIAAAGIYMVPTQGIKAIRLSSAGAVGGFKAYGLFT